MSDQYLLHLPDGTEYGPVDRATLETWTREGRLPPQTLAWPTGAPEWLTLEQALGSPIETASLEPDAALDALLEVVPDIPPAAAPEAAPVAAPAAPPAPERPDVAPKRAPVRSARLQEARRGARPDAGASSGMRALGLTVVGIAVVALLLAGLWAVLRPVIARRQAIAEVRRYALPDRRVEDPEVGLSIDLPPGWVSLRPDNPVVARPGARFRLANPAASAYGAISVAARPRFMDDLDGYLAELLQDRLPRQPSQREGDRSDVQLGRGQGRLVRTTWDDGLVPMQGATVAWADGYDLFALEAWAKASAGEGFTSELLALCGGIAPKGTVAARIEEAVEEKAAEVPELSREALRLLVAERLSEGRGLEDVPAAALRMVSRGLDALGAAEAEEMRRIYQQIWAPVPEKERVRLAAVLNEVKAGRPVRSEDLLALRTIVQAGVLGLPEDQRTRLQELSGRAVRKSQLLQ